MARAAVSDIDAMVADLAPSNRRTSLVADLTSVECEVVTSMTNKNPNITGKPLWHPN